MRPHVLLLCLALLAAQHTPAQKTTSLVILHTNDTHSCIFPQNSNLADTLLAGRGGFLRRLAMLQEERAQQPSLLLIDSGDFSQGSPYYTLFRGDVESDLMNMMGYDVGTIGNHEFDGGLDNMARVFRRLTFPIVCANYDFSGTALADIVKPYVVLKRNGVRIGLFGLSPELDGLVAQENYAGVTFRDPIATANEMIEVLRTKERCDVVICVSHLGWNTDPDYVGDNQVIAATHGIDLVLGGHSHIYLEELEYVSDAQGSPVAVDQNGKHGLFVGKITLTLTKK